MKKRAYLEWLIRQHNALKEQVEYFRGSRESEVTLKHLKREKLRIKDQITALLDELHNDECGTAQAS